MTTLSLNEAAKLALDVQYACNLAAVLNSWARCQRTLLDAGLGTDGLKQHPINIMFMSKVSSLMGVSASSIGCVTDIDDRDLFGTAYDAVQALAVQSKAA